MPEKLRYRAKGEQPLLQLNYEETPAFPDDPLLSDEEKEAREDRRTQHFLTSDELEKRVLFERLPDGVLDKQSLKLLQVEALHKTLDSSITLLGSATLYRSLLLPPADLKTITAKQDAVAELRNNDKLRQSVTDFLENFKALEVDFLWLINDEMTSSSSLGFPYRRVVKGLRGGELPGKMTVLSSEVQSAYLKNLVSVAQQYSLSKIQKIMRGPLYRVKKNLVPREDISFFQFRRRFYPRYWSPGAKVGLLPGMLSYLWGLSDVNRELFLQFYNENLFLFTLISMSPIMVAMLRQMKPSADYFNFLKPLLLMARENTAFLEVMDGVGKLDELQVLAEFSRGNKTVTPKIANESHHRFQATELRNPVLGKNNPNFVPNDVDLHGINFITGPNSGGKSTISRTVVQSQLLAQIGSDILAKEATIVPAQKIAYQAPQYDALQDTEGRFGTELKRTRDIFFSIGPLSLVILDELAEGTTSEEKMAVSRTTLEGFHTKGGTTMLVTHNHELVEQFKREGVGQDLQVEFNGETPTHKIIPGISTVSHADRVAKKVGFDRAAIEKHLKEEGYI